MRAFGKKYRMDPDTAVILEDLRTSHHILWDEVRGQTRSTLIDLTLDKLAELGYHEKRPYVFVITEEGLRALQAWGMGTV